MNSMNALIINIHTFRLKCLDEYTREAWVLGSLKLVDEKERRSVLNFK